MVEIALLCQFFGFSAGTAASRRPLQPLGGRCRGRGAAVVAWGRCLGSALPRFLASVLLANPVFRRTGTGFVF